MNLMKMPVLQALDDGSSPEPSLKELPSRHHPMLSLCQARHLLVLDASGRFDIDSATK